MIKEIAYLGRNNRIDLELTADKVPVDLSSVTKMQLSDETGTILIDSETSPGVFDWSVGNGMVYLSLGGITHPGNLESWTSDLYLIVYDASTTDGVVWDLLRISFKTVNPTVAP